MPLEAGVLPVRARGTQAPAPPPSGWDQHRRMRDNRGSSVPLLARGPGMPSPGGKKCKVSRRR